MIIPLIILFILGAVQGAIGWIMVKSGLVPEKFYVGHIELTIHFIAAMGLLSYTLWFALSLMPSLREKVHHTGLKRLLMLFFMLLFIQLIYGGFMAGLKAAITAPTWPDINGNFYPASFGELTPWWQNLLNNKLSIHFIHRGIAYLLFVLAWLFYFRSGNIKGIPAFIILRKSIAALIAVQLVLGICTVWYATNSHLLVWFGVSHQFTAMLLIMCMTGLVFITRKNKIVPG